MQTFNQALASLYHKRVISMDTALQRSSNVDELKELMEHGAGLNTGNRDAKHPSPYAQGRPIGSRPTINRQ
jgi:twitching motility protein PilT